MFKFANDKFTEYTTADGLPDGSIFALHTDRKGRLWIGSTAAGLARVDNPAEKLTFIRYTEKEGLTNDNVRCLTEDNFGNIYAGTVRGVSRINPENGQIKQISTADGLAADFVHAAFRDENGSIWFGTANGLSKFTPTKENEPTTPTIYLSNLQIAGETYGISEFGQQTIENIDVAASQMAMMDVPDHRAMFSAVRRVLKRDGVFVFSTLHPCFKARSFHVHNAPENLLDENGAPIGVVIRRYASEGHFNSGGTGVRGRMGSYHRMLSTCVNDLIGAGFAIERLEEPLDGPARGALFAEVPMALVIAARAI